MGSETFLEVLLAILLPPVGVFLRYGCGEVCLGRCLMSRSKHMDALGNFLCEWPAHPPRMMEKIRVCFGSGSGVPCPLWFKCLSRWSSLEHRINWEAVLGLSFMMVPGRILVPFS
ncbi:hypothetical protein CJ030_MR5G024981 [Morella rubra]|uniref:Uncharacterized protein n=1 Tax=Morella rubra TaxID=262757 RepID=A0A6A1VHS1_9ROSI|nr:hypothetical protein CJ030_MR5G024981 [Morella rubra]